MTETQVTIGLFSSAIAIINIVTIWGTKLFLAGKSQQKLSASIDILAANVENQNKIFEEFKKQMFEEIADLHKDKVSKELCEERHNK